MGLAADYGQDLKKFYPVLRGLSRVLEAFYARDWELKRAKNTLTFSDITHCALRLLVADYDWTTARCGALRLRKSSRRSWMKSISTNFRIQTCPRISCSRPCPAQGKTCFA